MQVFDYRKESKKQWGCEIKEPNQLTIEQIHLGCMLRIADAVELMATNHLKLQEAYDFMRKSRDDNREAYEQEHRRNKALKGVITKLKKKQA